MPQELAPARSSGPQQDPALPHTSTMPPPEPLSAGQQRSPGHSPTEQATEEDFQFLRCQGCQAEAKCPKLLPCLHTLCSGCLEVPSMQCPICKAPQLAGTLGPALDNVFFESLQRRLSVYRQIANAQAVCTRCRESADFWCFECEQLLCAKCFEAHQWFLKHEARPLAELRSQSVCEFLDSTRKSNNIFCSNPTHRTPELTSIYCRGCSKPLCCTCALLDSGHSDLKCGISVEIQQRQEELDSMTQALQEQDRAFGAVQAQMNSTVSRLARMRTETEELIRARVRQIVEHVRAQESLLMEAVNERYQRDYGDIAGQMGHLEAVLQRIRTGSALVQRMKRYASDQEVLEMHTFLREALSRLNQEKPQDLQAAVRTDGFDEFKECLQDLISCITQRTDAAPLRRANPEVASSPRDPSAVDLPERAQMAQAQPVGLAESQPVAVVQSVPGTHPMPMYAYSIKDPSRREEFSNTAISQKRKSCQTDSPRKVIKMESEAEKEARLAQSSPEQPRPSTSKAVSPPHLDKPTSPKTPTVGNEVLLLNSNHTTGDSEEAGPNAAPLPLSEERVVVISSSDDSDAENQHVEPTETDVPHSPPAHSLLRAPGASHPSRASHLPRGTCQPPSRPPHRPAEEAVIPDAESTSQPAGHQEHDAIHRGASCLSRRAQRAIHLRHVFRLPLKMHCAPRWTCPSPATIPAITGPPNHPANPQECPSHLQRASDQPHRARRASRSRGLSLRGSRHIAQWLNNFITIPLSSVAPQVNASVRGYRAGGRVLQTLGAGVFPQDSDRTPLENPQIQVPLEVLPLRPPENPLTSPDPTRTSL
ncbi:PML nuclear body scaffold [Rhinolophus ferrumequinum]|uniref:Protein PML n=1 Tax=Rhinolophus ferrumequinum TaxID=59479 RepID=A0A7J7XR07_RHIFE|nr:PML nuclear body scaffold [Rhinolophus ferrumequinum]